MVKFVVMHQEKWLRWERVSSILPLFIPLESGIKKMSGYFGSAWPKTVLVYTEQNVIWRNKWDDLYILGQELIDFFHKKGKEEKYWNDWQEETKNLKNFFQKLENLKLRDLSDKDLTGIFNKYVSVYESWWKYGWASTPIALQAEKLLSKQGFSEKDFKSLLSPPHKSFANDIEDDLANIVVVARKKGMDSLKVKQKIRNHASNYFWKANNYLETSVLTEQDVTYEVKQLLKQPIVKPKEIRKANSYKLKGESRFLVNLLSNFAYYKDYRKRYQMLAGHHLDKLLSEIGNRVGLSTQEMRYVLPSEIKDIPERGFLNKEIKNRQNNCLIIYDKDVEIYTGEKAKAKEIEVFGEVDFAAMNTVRGWGASPGNVVGKARIVMNPKDGHLLKDGEVLITAMTSPDFVTMMKKASAIVTDWGGITSHAAIVSRELSIPCIVGTNNATKVFKDGDKIKVNADEGTAEKYESTRKDS